MKRVVVGAAVGCAFTAATRLTDSAQTVLYLRGTGCSLPPTQAHTGFLRHEWADADDTLVGVAYPASPIAITSSVDADVNISAKP